MFRKIMVRVLNAQMGNVEFVETGFSSGADLIFFGIQ
jgi:hypothetical protein